MALPLDWTTLASFLVTSVLIELTPGPNMTYLALVSANDGRKAGVATVLGVTVGLAIVGLVAAVGVAEAVHASPILYQGLRWAGVLFLLYLAWEGWTTGLDVAAQGATNHRDHFVRGLITNLLNPKAAAFYATVLPTFIADARAALPQTIALTIVYVAVATAVHSAIVAFAGVLEPFVDDPKRERAARRILSAMLAVVALWFAWTTTGHR